MAGPLFANQVPDDLPVMSPSIQLVMEAQLCCGRSQELTLLWPSVQALARTLFPPGLVPHQPSWQQLHNK